MQSTHASSQPKTSGTRGRPRETTIQRLSGPHWKFEQSFWTADGKAAKTILEKTPVNTNDPSALKGPSKFGDHLHYGYDGARGFGTVNVEGPKTSFLRAANGKTSKYEWTTVSGLPRMFANELPWLHTEDYFTVQCTPTGIEEIRRTVSRPVSANLPLYDKKNYSYAPVTASH